MLGCNLIILWFLQLWVWLPTFLSLDQVRWKWTSFYCVCWLIKYEVKTFLFYIRIFKLSDITTLSLHELFSIISLFFSFMAMKYVTNSIIKESDGSSWFNMYFFFIEYPATSVRVTARLLMWRAILHSLSHHAINYSKNMQVCLLVWYHQYSKMFLLLEHVESGLSSLILMSVLLRGFVVLQLMMTLQMRMHSNVLFLDVQIVWTFL